MGERDGWECLPFWSACAADVPSAFPRLGAVSKWWYLTLSVILALLFSAYLLYDIQLLMGGKQNAISPDEYVYASVQIYVDVIMLFLLFLNIVGIAQS